MYNNYLKSSHWKRTKDAFYKTKRKRCVICHSKYNLNLHHNTYNNIGFEKENDLRCLCKDCHRKLHEYGVEKFAGHHRKLRKWFKTIP